MVLDKASSSLYLLLTALISSQPTSNASTRGRECSQSAWISRTISQRAGSDHGWVLISKKASFLRWWIWKVKEWWRVLKYMIKAIMRANRWIGMLSLWVSRRRCTKLTCSEVHWVKTFNGAQRCILSVGRCWSSRSPGHKELKKKRTNARCSWLAWNYCSLKTLIHNLEMSFIRSLNRTMNESLEPSCCRRRKAWRCRTSVKMTSNSKPRLHTRATSIMFLIRTKIQSEDF